MKKIIIILSFVLLGCVSENKYSEPETKVEAAPTDTSDHSAKVEDDSDLMEDWM